MDRLLKEYKMLYTHYAQTLDVGEKKEYLFKIAG
jgi:hypothetical protein